MNYWISLENVMVIQHAPENLPALPNEVVLVFNFRVWFLSTLSHSVLIRHEEAPMVLNLQDYLQEPSVTLKHNR